MKVKEVVQDSDNFVITNNGNILAINNGDGMHLGKHLSISKDYLLDMKVLRVQNSKDHNKDYHVNYILVRV